MKLIWTPKSGIQTKPGLQDKLTEVRLFYLYLSFWVGKLASVYIIHVLSHNIMKLFYNVPPVHSLFQNCQREDPVQILQRLSTCTNSDGFHNFSAFRDFYYSSGANHF